LTYIHERCQAVAFGNRSHEHATWSRVPSTLSSHVGHAARGTSGAWVAARRRKHGGGSDGVRLPVLGNGGHPLPPRMSGLAAMRRGAAEGGVADRSADGQARAVRRGQTMRRRRSGTASAAPARPGSRPSRRRIRTRLVCARARARSGHAWRALCLEVRLLSLPEARSAVLPRGQVWSTSALMQQCLSQTDDVQTCNSLIQVPSAATPARAAAQTRLRAKRIMCVCGWVRVCGCVCLQCVPYRSARAVGAARDRFGARVDARTHAQHGDADVGRAT